MQYYLAIDLGASSGRHILAHLADGRIVQEEIHRFKNDFLDVNGTLCWDLGYLFNEIITGMQKCAALKKIPSFVGIDSWGVDYVLLNKDGYKIGKTVSYRNFHGSKTEEEVFSLIPEAELYAATGIQKQPFNTIFQLYAQKLTNPEIIDQADTLLMLPCYFNYLLTGIKVNEYTIASTSGMLDAVSGNWDENIIRRLGLPPHIFKEIRFPGLTLGKFTQKITDAVGFSSTVVLTPSHDTASAVLASPYSGTGIFLSSGTWSLMGVENDAPITSENSRIKNFTNEGGFGNKYRFLKNIMGLWMLRRIRQEYGSKQSFDTLCFIAKDNEDFPSLIDVSDNRFLTPASMVDEVRAACLEQDMPVPDTLGKTSAVIYKSLAKYYGETARDIETLTGKKYDIVNIGGGGTRDGYLNILTARFCDKKVIAGPVEATSLGNISAQMIATGQLAGINDARDLIRNSEQLGEFVYGAL